MNQRGQVYPLFAFLLLAMVGISALSVDIGYYRYQQRVQQIAADTAAVAGAEGSFYSASNSNNAQNSALADAAANGFASPNATVSEASVTDAYTGPNGGIKVTITKTYPAFFGGIYGLANRSITTSAVAAKEAISNACITSEGQPPAITTRNGGTITGADCSIADNGDTTVNGGTPGKVDVQSWTVNGSASNTWNPSGDSQFTNSLGVFDPCQFVSGCLLLETATAAELGLTCQPSNSSCVSPSCTNPQSVSGSTANGGCYNNPTFNGTTLNPGLYVITGTVAFRGTITATGVTFYLTNGSTFDMSQNAANITLSAPTSGDIAVNCCGDGEQGVLFYQASPANGNTVQTATIAADFSLTGLSYLPATNLTTNGHPSLAITGNLTVNQVTMNGGSLTLTPGSGSQQGTVQQAVLVE